VSELIDLLSTAIRAAPARCGPVRVVAIDGGAAAGKSTLAAQLAAALPGSTVLHLDDLLAGWAGQFGYQQRLHSQLLRPLSNGRPGSYQRYDWHAGAFADRVAVPVPDVLLVEGVSAISGCGDLLSAAVFLDVERAERERRWVERDGPLQPEWRAWLDAEDAFFAAHPPPAAVVAQAGGSGTVRFMSQPTQPLEPAPRPPRAARKPVVRRFHDDEFVDDYEWLRDKADPEVLDYLRAENAYTDARTAELAELQERVFGEIMARTKQTDLSVPVRQGGYWYYSRTVEGHQYRLHCRVPATTATPPELDGQQAVPGEQVLLDGNLLAADSEFFALGTYDPSPDGRLLCYSVDLTGGERFTLRFTDLQTGQPLADEIAGAFYGSAWSADGRFVFYPTVDDTWRPDRIWRHAIGTDSADDVVVYTESDDRFWIDVQLSRDQRAIQISASSKLTSEVRFIDSRQPESEPVLVAARREGIEYQVEHAGDQLLILHNTNHPNFELSITGSDRPGPEHWQSLIPGSRQRRLLSVDAFAGHAVLHERRDGLANLTVLARAGDSFTDAGPIAFDAPLYRAVPGENPEWESPTYRLTYGSLATPDTVYDYDVAAGELVLRKRQPVLGGVELGDYHEWREWATAADGTRIPLSLVGRSDVARDGDRPVVLYGYGSYELSMEPSFSISRLSLLERGVIFAIAHVRGGGELGRHWYDEGKLLSKRNTFTDFIAAAEHLVEAGWTRPERIVAQGGSAGGLLMGAVANLAPRAFGGIVAQVPFVDALTSILDPSLPLTVTEWEEWGNPIESEAVYAYMKSYSPYENVAPLDYPPILAITSLNDTRVLYVEPAKWVAKLRATVADSDRILLKTEMDAGHGGRSGRYDAWREAAFYLAWELRTLGVA
jgi:oligopeptidase B